MIGSRRRTINTRSGALNDTRSESRRYTRDLGCDVVRGTGLAFSGGSLTDSGNGLGVFLAGQLIKVDGGATGDRTYIAGTVAAGSVALTPAPADLAAGATMEARAV